MLALDTPDIQALHSPERGDLKHIPVLKPEFNPDIWKQQPSRIQDLILLTSGLNRMGTISQSLIDNPLTPETVATNKTSLTEVRKTIQAMNLVFGSSTNTGYQSPNNPFKSVEEAKTYLQLPVEPFLEQTGFNISQPQPVELLKIDDPDHLDFLIGNFDILNHDIGTNLYALELGLENYSNGVPGFHELFERALDEHADVLIGLPENLRQPFAKAPIEVSKLEGLIQKRLRTLLQTSSIKFNLTEPSERAERFRKVLFSEVWSRSLVDNMIQNVLRKQTGHPPPQYIEIEMTPNEQNTHLVLMFRDDGYPIPNHITEQGFQEGEGDNSEGQHLAMGRLRKIIETNYQGSLTGKNVNGFAQIRVEIPYQN